MLVPLSCPRNPSTVLKSTLPSSFSPRNRSNLRRSSTTCALYILTTPTRKSRLTEENSRRRRAYKDAATWHSALLTRDLPLCSSVPLMLKNLYVPNFECECHGCTVFVAVSGPSCNLPW